MLLATFPITFARMVTFASHEGKIFSFVVFTWSSSASKKFMVDRFVIVEVCVI